jgi:hypothetical protein
VIGDLEEALRHPVRIDTVTVASQLVGDPFEGGQHRRNRERKGEAVRDQVAERQVHVAHGQGVCPRAAVAKRTGIGASAFWADGEAAVAQGANRAAAGSDRVDGQHRRNHAHARDLVLVATLEFTRIARHVSRGAAHVETERLSQP